MRVALLEGDEAILVASLSDLGLVQLASELAPDCRAVPVAEPLPAPQPDLPRDDGDPDQVWVHLFWNPADGPVVTHADAPRPTGRARLAVLGVDEIRNRYPDDRWRDVIDAGRSPVIRVVRSSWARDGRLRPGHVGAMAEWTNPQDVPADLRAKTRAAQELVRATGARLEPPAAARRPTRRRSRRERHGAVVWALPNAAAWVRDGGQIAWA